MSPERPTSRPRLPRIMVATDLSAVSEAAFRVALRLAKTVRGSLLILHVFEYSDAASPNTGGIVEGLFALRHAAERRLDELRQRAKKHELEAETVMNDGIASLAILEIIRTKQVDLAVMGTKAMSGVERFVIGSTAEEVFRKAPCPILTVGPRVEESAETPSLAGSVIFATDFNSASVQSVRYAAELCSQLGSSLHFLHVLPRAAAGNYDDAVLQTSTATLQRMVAESGVAMEKPVCAITYSNDISTGVVDYAKRHNADFIVLGVRRAPAMAAHLPAHITYRIVAEAACPVLTVAYDSHAGAGSSRMSRAPSVTG